MKNDWRIVPCPDCRGIGMVSHYTASGDDFLGAKECPHCSGGNIWVRPSDHIFLYPGGPAMGSWPGAYAKAEEINND